MEPQVEISASLAYKIQSILSIVSAVDHLGSMVLVKYDIDVFESIQEELTACIAACNA